MSEQKQLSSRDFLELATKIELDSVNTMLSAAGISKTEEKIPDGALSREKAEQQEMDEISNALSANSTLTLAAAARLAHEANRARRDINISTASHKKLRLSIYNTMYQRKLKLEAKLKGGQYA